MGTGLGITSSVAPVFAAELSPIALRYVRYGINVSESVADLCRHVAARAWQIAYSLGTCASVVMNFIVAKTSGPFQANWRLQAASLAVLSSFLLSMTWVAPESPSWCIQRGRYRAAFNAICSLRTTHLQAARDIMLIDAQINLQLDCLRTRSKYDGGEMEPEVRQQIRQRYWQAILHSSRRPKAAKHYDPSVNSPVWQALQSFCIVMVMQLSNDLHRCLRSYIILMAYKHNKYH